MKDQAKENSNVDICGTYAAQLSITEVGLGSLLHTFHLPLSGHFLSLNQILLLSRASCQAGKLGSLFIAGSISFIAAALKSLSPAGKKLTPMLAISMQGILFNLGIILFGNNILGRVFGACVSSLWGFLQPLLIYYFIFGQALFQTFVRLEDSFRNWVPMDVPSIWYICILAVLVKVFAAIGIVIFSSKLSHSEILNLIQKFSQSKLSKKPVYTLSKPSYGKIAIFAFKDLCVWPFLACVILSAISFLWVEGATYSWLVWSILRPIAVGFLFFFGIRILPLEKIATRLEESQFSALGKAFRIALNKIKEF